MALLSQKTYFNRVYKRISPIIKSKKTVPYFAITLTFLSLSFFGLFAIRPTLTIAVTLIKNVSDLKNLNIEYENKIGTIIRAQSEYEKIRDGIVFIDAAIPPDASFFKLAKTLEHYAQISNISLTQLQIENTPISNLPPSEKMMGYGFNLSAVGEYSSIVSYLQHILNWQKIITINSLDLSTEEGTISGALRMVLKGKTYYEP